MIEHSGYLRQLHERLAHVCQRAESLAKPLDHDSLNWKPSAEKWSIAQCLEHTLKAVVEYGEMIEPAVQQARAKTPTANIQVAPRYSFVGKMVLLIVEPTAKRKVPAPKSFKPAQSDIGDDILDRFLKSHEKISELVVEADGLDINRWKLSTPEVRIIRINMSDAFEILASHAERHIGQAERVRESEGFPA